MHNKMHSGGGREGTEKLSVGRAIEEKSGKLVYVNLKSFERKIRNKNTHKSHKMMLQKYKNTKLNTARGTCVCVYVCA